MHIPVLLEPAVRLWAGLDRNDEAKPGIYVDATFGGGGHSHSLLEKTRNAKDIIVIGLDRDQEQYQTAKTKYRNWIKKNKLFLVNENFANISEVISSFQNKKKKSLPVRGVLFDFGLSTDHLHFGRGFSFREENAPLDMRFNPEETALTAADILRDWRQEELEKIFREYGEERYSKKVARAIVEHRYRGLSFSKVSDLVAVLKKTLAPAYRKQKIHFATRVFQALRVTVNQEFENIEQGLAGALEVLDSGAKIVAVSFHSGEDRIVKKFFRAESKKCICEPNVPSCVCNHQKNLQIITRKPVTPENDEIKDNPNSRSAKLRAAERI